MYENLNRFNCCFYSNSLVYLQFSSVLWAIPFIRQTTAKNIAYTFSCFKVKRSRHCYTTIWEIEAILQKRIMYWMTKKQNTPAFLNNDMYHYKIQKIMFFFQIHWYKLCYVNYPPYCATCDEFIFIFTFLKYTSN